MEQIELKVTNRQVLGKKVGVLRRQGVTPLHLFGHGVESVALQCDTVGLKKVLAAAGQTRLINLMLEGEKAPRPVMVREVQHDPVTGASLHVDFYQVQMTEQVKVEVPVVLVGESPALKLKENMLIHELNALTIECLPAKIPSSVAVDLSSLTEVDQALRVKNIKLDEGITVLDDPEHIVVKIGLRHIEKPKEAVAVKAVEEVAEAAEAGAATEAKPEK